jgi:hypothetical protein
MSLPLVIDYLRNHTLKQLSDEHGVGYRLSGNKFSLNYDMIEAKEDNQLASQCRGLVLFRCMGGTFDENVVVGTCVILARPMDRFFNHGQGHAAQVDFSTAKFFEKLDGTMIAFYFDPFTFEWHTATRSVPEANLPIDGFDKHTFRSLFEKAVVETSGLNTFFEWLKKENLNAANTYIFELCTPENQIVVPYTGYQTKLLAIRNNASGQEYEIENSEFDLKFIPACPAYSLSSFDDMMSFVSQRNPSEHEGIVVRDNQFRRIKIKNAGYMALNKIRDNALKSPRSLLQLCLSDKIDDAMPLLPAHAVEKAQEMRDKLIAYKMRMLKVYENMYSLALGICTSNQWDAEDPQVFRKALAIATQQSNKANMQYVMLRFTARIYSFHEYLVLQKDEAGEYKTSFLDHLLAELNNL